MSSSSGKPSIVAEDAIQHCLHIDSLILFLEEDVAVFEVFFAHAPVLDLVIWGEQIIPITKAHLVTLRQIGHEVLRSLGGEQAPVEPVVQEFGPFEEPLVGHTLQEFKPLGGDPSWATLYMRCGTVAGPGPEGWRELCVKVTPVDTEIGIYSFICPYCKGELVWDPRELRTPQEIEAIRNRMRSSGQAHKA